MSDDLLPYGYEPCHVAALARQAARKPRYWGLFDHGERCDIASLAIIERLYLGEDEPSNADLLKVADRAIDAAAGKAASHYGVARYGTATGRNFAVYWRGTCGPVPFEERLIESIALYEIFPMLSPRHREVLAAVARHWGNRTAAADELGCTRMALMIALSKARAEFRWYWFWPEQAPRHWGRDHGTLTTHDSSGENRAIKAIKRRRREAA